MAITDIDFIVTRVKAGANSGVDAWPAWEILKETIDREPVSITDGAKITLVENGALRKALCIEKKYGKSLFKPR